DPSSAFDLDAHAGGQGQPHQGVDHPWVRVEDVDDALVRAHLELLARGLVDEGAANHGERGDLGGKRDGAGSARVRTAGGVHDLVRRLVQHPVVIGLEPDPNLLRQLPCPSPYLCVGYLTTSVTTPAPTVLPPSRMANRSAGSMPIGSPRVMSITTLSPGITISTPSGSLTSPVTSVVRIEHWGRYPVRNGVRRPPPSLVR